MVQHPKRESKVKVSPEWQILYVGLKYMNTGKLPYISVSHLHGLADVHSKDVSGSGFPGYFGMTTLTAAGFQDQLTFEHRVIDRIYPVEELLAVTLVQSGK